MHASDLDRANTYNQLNLPVQSSWGPSAIIELLFGVILTFLTVLAIYLAHQYHHTRQRSNHEESVNPTVPTNSYRVSALARIGQIFRRRGVQERADGVENNILNTRQDRVVSLQDLTSDPSALAPQTFDLHEPHAISSLPSSADVNQVELNSATLHRSLSGSTLVPDQEEVRARPPDAAKSLCNSMRHTEDMIARVDGSVEDDTYQKHKDNDDC